MIFRIITLTCVLVIVQTSAQRHGGSNGNKQLVMTFNDAESLQPHSRHKRGWGSIVFYGTSILVRATTLGLDVAGAVSQGCSYYKSICEDRDAIVALDKQIQVKKQAYDQEYVKSATEWVKLRNAGVNNGYMSYYIEEVVRKVQTLASLESKISDELELRVPKLFANWKSSKNNVTSEDYLNVLIGRLEYSLSDLQSMLKKTADGQATGMVVQFLVEIAINKFVFSYKKNYNQIRAAGKQNVKLNALWVAITEADVADARVLLTPEDPNYKRVMAKYGIDTGAINSKGRVKLVPKVLARMFQNTKKYFANGAAGFSGWKDTVTWNRFKADLKNSLSVPLSKLTRVKAFFTNKQFRKYYVKSFKLDFTSRIMVGIGIIADTIDQALQVAQWATVAKEMTKARQEYQKFYDNLNNALVNIQQERANVTAEWNTIAKTFIGMSTVFKELFKNASKNSDFADVLGLPKLPISPTGPLSTIQFDSLNKTTLPAAQAGVLHFMRENGNNLTKIVDEMTARLTLYTSVNNMTEKREPIGDISSDLTNIYRFSRSGTIRKFGESLKKKDIVCTVAILSPGKSAYDYYSLPPFRPRCDVNALSFAEMDQNAAKLRKMEILYTVVATNIKKDKSVSATAVLSLVKNAYSLTKDNTLVAYGKSLTVQDVVCAVASQFGGMKDFDFISLAPFRPDCSAVSSSQFTTMKQNADKLRTLTGKVSGSLDTCDQWQFCPCISMMAQRYGATTAEVTDAIKRLRPQLTKYCGTTGCSCVDL